MLVSRETPPDVLAAAARPLPSVDQLRDMSMYDLYCGKHLDQAGSATKAHPIPFQTSQASTDAR